MAERALIPLNVHGAEQFFISVRHGHLMDKARLMALLRGEWGRDVNARAAAAAAGRRATVVGSLGGRKAA